MWPSNSFNLRKGVGQRASVFMIIFSRMQSRYERQIGKLVTVRNFFTGRYLVSDSLEICTTRLGKCGETWIVLSPCVFSSLRLKARWTKNGWYEKRSWHLEVVLGVLRYRYLFIIRFDFVEPWSKMISITQRWTKSCFVVKIFHVAFSNGNEKMNWHLEVVLKVSEYWYLFLVRLAFTFKLQGSIILLIKGRFLSKKRVSLSKFTAWPPRQMVNLT